MKSSTASALLSAAPDAGAVAAAATPSHPHTSIGGFCAVCGSVWPCKQADVEAAAARYIPVARW